MREQFGSVPRDLVVQLSPCIRPPHYEVDFAAEIVRQVRGSGVEKVYDSGRCTACDLSRYYSYRAEKARYRPDAGAARAEVACFRIGALCPALLSVRPMKRWQFVLLTTIGVACLCLSLVTIVFAHQNRKLQEAVQAQQAIINKGALSQQIGANLLREMAAHSARPMRKCEQLLEASGLQSSVTPAAASPLPGRWTRSLTSIRSGISVRRRYHGFWPMFLIGLSLLLIFAWEIWVGVDTRRAAQQLQEQQVRMVDQAKQVQAGLEKLVRGLVDLSKTDDAAKKVITKFGIKVNNPSVPAATPTP